MELGRRERQIMDAIYRLGRATVAEVRAGRLLPPEEAVPVYLRDDVATPKGS